MLLELLPGGSEFIRAMREKVLRLSKLERHRLRCPYDFTLDGKIAVLEVEVGKQVLVAQEFLVGDQFVALLQEVGLDALDALRYREAALGS